MPFTGSHPAAVLPFLPVGAARRRRWSSAAWRPDFPYYLPGPPPLADAHRPRAWSASTCCSAPRGGRCGTGCWPSRRWRRRPLRSGGGCTGGSGPASRRGRATPPPWAGRCSGWPSATAVGLRVRLGAEHPAAPAGEVTEHRADDVVRHPDDHLVHRLQQGRSAALGGVAQGQRAGGLERRVGRVDAVRLAVDQGDPQVHHRVTGEDAALQLGPDALLHGRDVVVRHRAADHPVDELEAGARGQRLHLDVGTRRTGRGRRTA